MSDPRYIEVGPSVLTVHGTDALSALRQMADESVQMVVTSPPYWSLRDYGIEPIVWDETVECDHQWGSWTEVHDERESQKSGKSRTTDRFYGDESRKFDGNHQKHTAGASCICGAWLGCLGLEPTPELYVQHIVQIFREVRRVLRKDGTLWLNLGDSYSGSGRGLNGDGSHSAKPGEKQYTNKGALDSGGVGAKADMHDKRVEAGAIGRYWVAPPPGLKQKDLVGIPWMVAFALRADGWWLRSDIIWSKPNPMPESVTDRPTRAHEYIFLLTKSQKYFYDAEAIKEPIADSSIQRINQPNFENQTGGEKDYSNGTNPNRSARKSLENFAKGKGNAKTFRGGGAYTQSRSFDNSADIERDSHGNEPNGTGLRNARSVWSIATAPFPEAHFATFPTDLVIPCVLAGSKAGDVVLDPFGGSGTVGKVAIELGRKAILIEPKAEYVAMIEKRTTTTMGLPL